MAKKKENYLGARLSDEQFNFIKNEFPGNLSKGLGVSIEAYQNVLFFSLGEIRKQKFTGIELKSLIRVKSLSQAADRGTMEMVAIENNTDPVVFLTKIDSLDQIVKYILFKLMELYDFDELRKKIGVVD